jgi:hypothetical protein
VVVEVAVPAEHDFLAGQPVRALAIDYRLLPLHLVGKDGTVRPQPFEARLAAGDCLTVVIALTDLQKLLNREALPQTCAVKVTACPLPARPWLAQLVRTTLALSAEDAQVAVEKLPLSLGNNLTRGQAEDLLYRLQREQVAGHIVEPERK